ncbi:MAG: 1-deoxy-D-xylulose-5-phosphate reductoisomerase, partial [candidate division Zixibacteria bacterium]|nr:1-deoxy-D-xylulose-5-phosphate reductoisomerase [candidate division Zixibacteria bacterium]
MSVRNIVILGSTGSIGRSTLTVLDRHPGFYKIIALAAYSNLELLVEQYRRYKPEYLCLVDETRGRELTALLKDEPVQVLVGEEALVSLAA